MKKVLSILILLILLFGCSKNDSSPECNVDNPLEMNWMKDIISDLQNCACAISVFQAEYEGDVVFWLLMTDPLCQGVIENVPVYNCKGEEILVLNNYQNWVNFNEKTTGMKIIYVCSK